MQHTVHLPFADDGAMCAFIGGPFDGRRRRVIPLPDALVPALDVVVQVECPDTDDGIYARYRRVGDAMRASAWQLHFEGYFDNDGLPASAPAGFA